MMLRTVKPINVEIMYHQEKQHLQSNRPRTDEVQGGQMPGPVQRHNDIVEDENLQEITLNEGIPYQVYPKTVAENGHPPGIGEFSLQPDKDEHAQHQDAGSI